MTIWGADAGIASHDVIRIIQQQQHQLLLDGMQRYTAAIASVWPGRRLRHGMVSALHGL